MNTRDGVGIIGVIIIVLVILWLVGPSRYRESGRFLATWRRLLGMAPPEGLQPPPSQRTARPTRLVRRCLGGDHVTGRSQSSGVAHIVRHHVPSLHRDDDLLGLAARPADARWVQQGESDIDLFNSKVAVKEEHHRAMRAKTPRWGACSSRSFASRTTPVSPRRRVRVSASIPVSRDVW